MSFADPITPDSRDEVGARARGWLLTTLKQMTLRVRPTGPRNGREAFQLRFLVGASLLGIVVGVLSLPATLYTGQRLTTGLITSFIALLVGQLVTLRLGAAVERVAWAVLTTVWLFLVAVSLTTRTLEPAQLAWQLLIPLAARALDAPRPDDAAVRSSSVMWVSTTLAILGAAFVVAAHQLGLTASQPPPVAQPAWVALLDFALLAVSAVGLVLLHDHSVHETAAELQRLRAMLSICAWCREIRHEGEWISLERYVQRRTRSGLSHGICPRCTDEHFPEGDVGA
jgi:lysylphosphatidylglycerol synthetase-like protein (DUF2156 family)